MKGKLKPFVHQINTFLISVIIFFSFNFYIWLWVFYGQLYRIQENLPWAKIEKTKHKLDFRGKSQHYSLKKQTKTVQYEQISESEQTSHALGNPM